MIAIPIRAYEDVLAKGFRKAPRFLLIEGKTRRIVTNPCRGDKSDVFFAWFDTLGVRKIYIENIGLRTFWKLQRRGIDVYLVQKHKGTVDMLDLASALPLTEENAEKHCTMGHR